MDAYNLLWIQTFHALTFRSIAGRVCFRQNRYLCDRSVFDMRLDLIELEKRTWGVEVQRWVWSYGHSGFVVLFSSFRTTRVVSGSLSWDGWMRSSLFIDWILLCFIEERNGCFVTDRRIRNDNTGIIVLKHSCWCLQRFLVLRQFVLLWKRRQEKVIEMRYRSFVYFSSLIVFNRETGIGDLSIGIFEEECIGKCLFLFDR